MFTESRAIFTVSGAMFTAVTGDADYIFVIEFIVFIIFR